MDEGAEEEEDALACIQGQDMVDSSSPHQASAQPRAECYAYHRACRHHQPLIAGLQSLQIAGTSCLCQCWGYLQLEASCKMPPATCKMRVNNEILRSQC